MAKKNRHAWTKGDIKKVLLLWESKDVAQIADELGVTSAQVSYIAKEVRLVDKNALPKKYVRGRTQTLIKEVLSSLK